MKILKRFQTKCVGNFDIFFKKSTKKTTFFKNLDFLNFFVYLMIFLTKLYFCSQVPLLSVMSVAIKRDLNARQKGDFQIFKTHDILCNLPDCAEQAKVNILIHYNNKPGFLLGGF